jgi:hypothetical protein
MVIFHSYVSLPEGTVGHLKIQNMVVVFDSLTFSVRAYLVQLSTCTRSKWVGHFGIRNIFWKHIGFKVLLSQHSHICFANGKILYMEPQIRWKYPMWAIIDHKYIYIYYIFQNSTRFKFPHFGSCKFEALRHPQQAWKMAASDHGQPQRAGGFLVIWGFILVDGLFQKSKMSVFFHQSFKLMLPILPITFDPTGTLSDVVERCHARAGDRCTPRQVFRYW